MYNYVYIYIFGVQSPFTFVNPHIYPHKHVKLGSTSTGGVEDDWEIGRTKTLRPPNTGCFPGRSGTGQW